MPPKIEAAKTATFVTDDKRAQYARLAVFNWGVKEKLIPKDKDVNTATTAQMQAAFKSLAGSTFLEGKDGVAMISTLTKAGATDEKVASKGLTAAYAQEVRPFIKRGLLSDKFGRRGKPKVEKAPAPTAAEKKAAKAAAKEAEAAAAAQAA